MAYLGALFGKPIRVTIPAEFARAAALLAYLKLDNAELRKIWYYKAGMYHHFQIAKGPGKVRNINAPDDRLKHLQRKLALKLAELYRRRDPVHGFVPDRSIKTNASVHLRRRYIVNIDLKEFFPTITQNRIAGMLAALGIDGAVAGIIAHICCVGGCLPQGSPTSPILSNMICFRLDKRLMEFARTTRCLYTRYADDITFSSHQPPVAIFEGPLPPAGRLSSLQLSSTLHGIVMQNGFTINPDKVHYADRYSRRIVTGLKVNELINVDRHYIRNIRAILHSVEMLGVADATKKLHDILKREPGLSEHLRGKISFVAHIKGQADPVVRSLVLRFNKYFPARPIKLLPTPVEIRERAVWIVEHDGNQGSAFFLKGVGLVTAEHCVTGVTELDIFHPSKHANKFKAKVQRSDQHRDLAILDHEIPATEYFELGVASKVVATGDLTMALGYPDWGFGDKLSVRQGTVSSLPVKSGVDYVEVTEMIFPGMSGGPLLDENDGVTGINHKGGPEQVRNLAVHIKVLQNWLKAP